jgi:spore germination cell wall hydrolase CwlJ-like protein
LECRLLGEAGYFEARGEPQFGMLAVMQTILNRRDSPSFDGTIKEVLYAPHQFSYTTRRDKRMSENKKRELAFSLAYQLLQNQLKVPKEWRTITHFHAKRVNPLWTKRMKPVIEIGNHRFYSCEC